MEIDLPDFVYADPPYDVEFTTYSAGVFRGRSGANRGWLANHAGGALSIMLRRARPFYRSLIV